MEKKQIKLPIYYNSPVILTFALVCLVVLVLDFFTAGASTYSCFMVYRSNISPLWFVRLFGHVLGHSGWEHYLGNMTTMLLVGPMLEEKYGSRVMLILITITALICGVTNILFFSTGLLGASGVVFMMIVLSSVTGVRQGQIPLTLIAVVVLYLGEQVVAGIFSRDNISQFTHIVGGVLGMVYGLVLSKGGKN